MIVSGDKYCKSVKTHRGIAIPDPELSKPETPRKQWFLIHFGFTPALPIPKHYGTLIYF